MFDFFYGDEPKQYAFYSIPQLLFTDEKFKKLSCESKVLYGLLLDKAGLSAKNGWTDDDGKVYVYFKREDACSMLGCKKDKATKIFAELDDEKGIGLIKRVSQGQGKPTKIYVRHFLRVIDTEKEVNPANLEQRRKSISFEQDSSDVGHDNKTDVKGAEKPPSRSRKNRSLESGKSAALPISHTNRTILSESIYSLNQQPTQQKQSSKKVDMIEKNDFLTKIEEINERISTDCLLSIENTNGEQAYCFEEIDELTELIAWVELTSQPALRINGEFVDTELVRIQFAKLTEEHIQYVLDSVSENTVKIYQRRNYLLTCLYNAPISIEGSIKNQVNCDLSKRCDSLC